MNLVEVQFCFTNPDGSGNKLSASATGQQGDDDLHADGFVLVEGGGVRGCGRLLERRLLLGNGRLALRVSSSSCWRAGCSALCPVAFSVTVAGDTPGVWGAGAISSGGVLLL
jgi:hypothetical protein